MAKEIIKINKNIAKRTADNFMNYGISLLSQKDGVHYFETLTTAVAAICFSCELYLKILLNIEKISISKKHLLDYLFNELTSDYKEEIEATYNAIIKDNTSGAYKYQTLEECLEMHKNGFDDFRYVHEDEKLEKELQIDSKSLPVLGYCLKMVCERHMQAID